MFYFAHIRDVLFHGDIRVFEAKLVGKALRWIPSMEKYFLDMF
jgi:hypothetical protein